jgi:hypothetical protein
VACMSGKNGGRRQWKRGNRRPHETPLLLRRLRIGDAQNKLIDSIAAVLLFTWSLLRLTNIKVFEIAAGLDSFEQAPFVCHPRGLDLWPRQGCDAGCA